MTLTTSISRVEYSGTGTSGPFAFTYKVYAATDLQVTLLDASNIETTLTYPADFSVTGIGNGAGGTITTTDAVASGETITIRRVRPLTQLVNLTNQGPFLPANYEDALDKLAMVSQQLDVDFDRAVKVANSTDISTFDTTLPTNLTAGDAIVVNATADGFSMGTLSAAQLSAWNATANLQLDSFVANVGFTPGVSTTVTLSSDPGNEDNCLVTMRVSGTVKVLEHDEYSVSATTLTFASVIPAGATLIEVTYMLFYQVNTVLAQNVPWTQLGTGASTRNVRDKLREIVTPYDFGAVGDGTTDDTTAYTNAIARAHTLNGTVAHPAGTFKITSNVTANDDVTLDFSGGGLLTIATTKVVTVSGRLIAPRAQIFTGLGTAVLAAGSFIKCYPEWFGAVHDDSTDDAAAINAAAAAIATAGGVLSFTSATYKIASTVSVTRGVNLEGDGSMKSVLHGAGSTTVQVTGGDVGTTWGKWTARGLAFKGATLKWGVLVGDVAAGSEAIDCLFQNSTTGLYQGFNNFMTTLTRCAFVDCTTGINVDFTTAGATSGAMMRYVDCEFHDSAATGLAHNGVTLTGAPSGGASIFFDHCEFERLTIAGVNITGGTNRELVILRDSHFELMDAAAYFVINDGALVTLDGLWSFSATESGWIESTGGVTTLAEATGNWLADHFALISGGVIKVDQDRIYSPSKFWGDGLQRMWVAGSTNGGDIVSLASRARGYTNKTTGSLTNAAPTATAIQLTVAGDANNRWYTCLVDVTAMPGVNSAIRFQFADGANSVNCDLTLPLFVGKAAINIVWIRGTTITAYGIFSGTTPAATTTKGLDSGAQTDTLDIGLATTLTISTLAGGGTAATMNVLNLTEEVQAPYIADT